MRIHRIFYFNFIVALTHNVQQVFFLIILQISFAMKSWNRKLSAHSQATPAFRFWHFMSFFFFFIETLDAIWKHGKRKEKQWKIRLNLMSFINIHPPSKVLSFCLTSNKKAAKIFIPSGVVYTQKTQWMQIFDDGNDSQENRELRDEERGEVKLKVKLIMPSPSHVVGVKLRVICIKY